MEDTLTSDMTRLDVSSLKNLHEQAAVLKYLADQALAHPPPDGKGETQFVRLSKNLVASVETLLLGLRANDTKAVMLAVSKLKPAYAKLFVKFG
jgi:hypothetical protein